MSLHPGYLTREPLVQCCWENILRDKTRYDNSLGVFNTKYFCFYVSFIFDPSHHTEYGEQNMTWVCHDLEQRFRLARPITRPLRGLCSVLVPPQVSRPLGPSGQKGHVSLPGACESDLSTCCPHHSHTGTHIPEGADTVSGDPVRPSLTQ